MRIVSGLVLALVLACAARPSQRAVAADSAAPGNATSAATAGPDYSWVDKLPRQTGQIDLGAAKAKLNLGDGYYFLGPSESRRVLTELWRNPPGSADGVMGMIFPRNSGPLDNGAWAAVVTYEDAGYVSDADAAKIDPPKLLEQLRKGEAAENEQRRKAGYDPVHLAGWAEPPSYDAASHSAVWARDIAFADRPQHTLNYGIRILGRHGVLSLDIIAPLASLPQVNQVSAQVRQLAAYDPGSRYADVDKSHDKMAAYGVAGLIAAGVGVAVVKKLGFLAVLLLFAKKGFVLIAAAAAGLFARFRSFFGNLFGKKPGPPPPGSSGGGPQIVT
ncbi:MAG TPA: DUF2167 domain-containing protein [Caulobacteraceae bacterium]